MTTVDNSFFYSLATRLDDENTIGVTMSGSFPRGEGGRFSDVDLQKHVYKEPEDDADSDYLRVLDDMLVSVQLKPHEVETAIHRMLDMIA